MACDKLSGEPVAPRSTRLEVIFFRVGRGGAVPVRDWLKSEMAADDRRAIGNDIATVEFGWPVGMPTCRPLGDGLWEVRSNISNGRIARVLFFIERNRMVLLHGFIKKSAQIPKSDLDLARTRKKDMGR